jgi:hypothetical protein
MVVAVASLIATGTALAASTSLKLTGPSGVTLKHDQNYTVRASGTTNRAGVRLFIYEGGQVRGGTAAISCYSTESSEHAQYHPSARVHVFLGSRHVLGAFSYTFAFEAANPGPRSFCAYLASTSGGTTYAHAALHWTNSSS